MKKQVAIIYNGQIRTNPLSVRPHGRGSEILNSIKEHFLNDEFKEEYDYDVFVSTDNLDVQAANEFFENRLVNVALWEERKILHPISSPMPDHSKLYGKFQSIDFQGYPSHSNQYHQYYRASLAYQMIIDYQKKYDYFIIIRPDLKFQKSILHIFQELENGRKVFMEHNLFSVASFEMIDVYFELAHRYGEFHVNRGDGGNTCGEYPNFCPMNCNNIKFSSEMQETNCFYYMLEKRGYNPQEHFFGSVYNGEDGNRNTYCTLVR